MYIIELIAKLKNKYKQKNNQIEKKEAEDNCSHVFSPLDSTKKYYACTKCGIVIKESEIKSKNFFINN